MELNINSPAYYSVQYGIDNEVYRFCQYLYMNFKDKEYSDTLNIIGLMPVVAPQEMYDSGKWQEQVRLRGNKSVAVITIRMDFEKYHKGDSNEKMIQMKDIILQAVRMVRSRGKFDYQAFEKDLNALWEAWGERKHN